MRPWHVSILKIFAKVVRKLLVPLLSSCFLSSCPCGVRLPARPLARRAWFVPGRSRRWCRSLVRSLPLPACWLSSARLRVLLCPVAGVPLPAWPCRVRRVPARPCGFGFNPNRSLDRLAVCLTVFLRLSKPFRLAVGILSRRSPLRLRQRRQPICTAAKRNRFGL